MIPYDDILETADRRQTFRLLDRLVCPDVDEAELDDLMGALQEVSDPRAVDTLESILTDSGRSQRVREAASYILRGMHYLVLDIPEAKLRRWWQQGDWILRWHALLCTDAIDCPDILLEVARDPGHEFHAEAVGCMMFHFDRPEHQKIKITALTHPDARVREIAAGVLLWDEPAAAEGPLITATRDPVPAVAAEAANTLQYYPSLRVARCLYGLLDHPDDNVREEARKSYQSIRDDFRDRLHSRDRPVAAHIRNWLRPVWEMLAFTDEELRPYEDNGPSPDQDEAKETMPVFDLMALLTDPDASPRVLSDRFWHNDWIAYSEQERSRLRPVLLRHPDPLVRELAALCLGAWEDVPGLMELELDSVLGVCKSAIYHLGQLPPTPGVAEIAWEHLNRPDVLGVHATESLDTFVQHADPAVAVGRLGLLAGDHGRHEEIRSAAVDHLARLDAREQLSQLMGLLLEPPAVTWALHIALLDAIADLRLSPPDIGPLGAVDNLAVQEAVAGIGGE